MKSILLALARLTLIGVLMLNTWEPSSVSAKGKDKGGYQTGFIRWRAAQGGFTGWSLDGVIVNSGGELELASTTQETDPYPPGGYNGKNYYNGGTFFVGEAISPEITTDFNYQEAIASWNAATPAGTWVEIQFRAIYGSRWSKWYVLGIWAADDSTIRRHSVQSQGDTDGYVAVDTFVSTNKKETTDKFQFKLRLFSEDGNATPIVKNASVAYSTAVPKSATASSGVQANWNTLLNVPECSQMVYPDGGEIWCSPTSTSMVLAYWNPAVLNPGSPLSPCEQQVEAAVEGVFDWVYDGHGNWPFNTAYAAALGYEGYVARFTSLVKAEEFVNAGVPVIMSIAWDKGELTNSDIPSTNGHLLVLVGFDPEGNPIVNDPASPSDQGVQRTYLRAEFEPLWLQASGGTVYLIYPENYAAPVP
jgi:Peptidase_C39 like family